MYMLSYRASLAIVHILILQPRGSALTAPRQMINFMASSLDEALQFFLPCMYAWICISVCMQYDLASDQYGSYLRAQRGVGG